MESYKKYSYLCKDNVWRTCNIHGIEYMINDLKIKDLEYKENV